MKILLLAFFLFINSFGGDYKFIVNNYQQNERMTYQIELVSREALDNRRLLLDCQSFIPGLHYLKLENGKWSDEWFVIMWGDDCDDSRNYVIETIDRGEEFCLRANPESKLINFYSDLSFCAQLDKDKGLND